MLNWLPGVMTALIGSHVPTVSSEKPATLRLGWVLIIADGLELSTLGYYLVPA